MKKLALLLLVIVFCLCLLFLLTCGGVFGHGRILGRNLHNHAFFVGLLLLPWAVISNIGRHRLGLLKRNFRGRTVLSSYGVDMFGYLAILAALKVVFHPGATSDHVVATYVSAMGAMWALGLIDDIAGDKATKGIRGHFRELFLRGRLTTGALKAIGGLTLGLFVGIRAWNGDWRILVSAMFIVPLAANAINILDLRPGRACGGFLFAMFLLTGLGLYRHVGDPYVIAVLMVVAVAWLYVDAPGSAMMGDSGANMLGAILGTYIVLNTTPTSQFAAVALLLAFNIHAETHSITDLVESRPWLRWLDSQLGVR